MEYDPPPVADLQLPEGGAFQEGESMILTFSEPVDPASVQLRVWPNQRDIENEIAADAEPFVDSCGADDSCGDLETELSEGDTKLGIAAGGDLGKPGQPLILELLPGLADLEGNTTGASRTWDVQFRSGAGENVDPVAFDDGVYVVLAQVEDPLPAVLTLVSDIRVLEDGRFALAGAEGDEINGAPKNTRDPENLVIDETDQGFTAYATGFVSLDDAGKRLLETEPFDVTLPVGPLEVRLKEVRLFAEIVKNDETGMDRLDGTLSFSSLTLVNGDRESPQEGSSTALIADRVPEELIPAGTPQMCSDLCGAVELGLCEPPEDFPGEEFCAE